LIHFARSARPASVTFSARHPPAGVDKGRCSTTRMAGAKTAFLLADTEPVCHHARNRSMNSNSCFSTGKTATTNFEPGWLGKIVDYAEVHDQSNEILVEGDEECGRGL
jgi:hypothetical protein